MVGFLRWLVSVFMAAIIIVFALVNRTPVAVTWSPVHGPVDLPLFLPVVGGLFVGFLFGGLIVWFNGAATRRDRRKQRKTIERLENELTRLQGTPAPSSSALLADQSAQDYD
ncbi:MAG: LapA family protein [Rhodospirillales bacterium]|nr:LapA family protein [Rhodospirillales bacterium]